MANLCYKKTKRTCRKKINKDMQETLYDTVGNPIAYLDIYDGNIIYLWNGIPVDYVEPDGGHVLI